MHEFLHILLIVGRIAVVGVGCLAFYVAFFLYPDQEGRLQNRIEDVWVSVNDRAKVTGRLSIALFNRVAAIVERLFNRIFGARRFSYRLVSLSMNLSLAIPMAWLVHLYAHVISELSGMDILRFIVLPLSPTVCAAIAIWCPRRWIVILTSIPVWIALCAEVLTKLDQVDTDAMPAYLLTMGSAVLLSIGSDICAVLLIRWSLSRLAEERSLLAIVQRIVVVAVLMFVIALLPWCLLLAWYGYPPLHSYRIIIYEDFTALIAGMNLATAIYCLVPVTLSLTVLGHRLLWPILNRLIFPIARFELIKNRKAMAGIGSLAILAGLGLKKVTLEDILKLFG
jgi:hypothetical protein